MDNRFDSKKLNDIISNIFNSVDEGKSKAYSFHHTVMSEVLSISTDIELVKTKMLKIDKKIEKAREVNKEYRALLAEVILEEISGENNSKYRDIYEEIERTMRIVEELEKEYEIEFKKRDKLDRSLKKASMVLGETENLMNIVETLSRYLTNNFVDISLELDKRGEILLKIIEAGEVEKKRIARDIHDGPAQTFVHLNLEIQLLKSLIRNKEMDKAINEVNKIETHIKGAATEIREIIYNLRPMSLDDLGLIPTIENYIKTLLFNENNSIDIKLNVYDESNLIKEVPEVLSLSIFRVIQECITNTYKHANASNIVINIAVEETQVVLSIKDNGDGFDASGVFTDIRTNGKYGLIGIKERIELVEGRIKVESKIGQGTKINIVIPWNKK